MQRWRSVLGIVAVAASLIACGRGDDDLAGDTAALAATADSAGGMAGMSGMDMNRPPAKDADHEFLRMMSDHHEGLIQMATTAMSKGSNQTVQGDAHRLHTQQQAEQKRMLDVVRDSYGESVTPMVMGSDKSMVDELKNKTGGDFDRTFYSNVIMHHREAIKMVDDFSGRLIKADVKAMAAKMKADQQKEIREFESKAKG